MRSSTYESIGIDSFLFGSICRSIRLSLSNRTAKDRLWFIRRSLHVPNQMHTLRIHYAYITLIIFPTIPQFFLQLQFAVVVVQNSIKLMVSVSWPKGNHFILSCTIWLKSLWFKNNLNRQVCCIFLKYSSILHQIKQKPYHHFHGIRDTHKFPIIKYT